MLCIFILLLEFFLIKIGFYGLADNSLATIFITFFSLAYIVYLKQNEKLCIFTVPMMMGYVFRLCILYLDLFGKGIINIPNSGGDSEWFFAQGLKFITNTNSDTSFTITTVGTLLKLCGENRLFAQFVLMMFSMVAIQMFVYCMLYTGISYCVSYKILMIICLLPNFAILSSLFLRESIVTMFVCIGVTLFLRWIIGGSLLNLVLAIACNLIATIYHSGTIGVILGFLLTIVIYDRAKKCFRINMKSIFLVILIVVGMLYFYTNYADVFFSKMLNVSSIENIANMSTEGGSSYAQYVGNSNSIINMIIYTPVRMIYFLGSPFPWQIRGIADIIAFLFNSIVYLYALVKSMKEYLQTKNEMILIVLIICASTAFIFSWGVSNVGTAIRHRDKMVAIYGLLIALSKESEMKPT